MAANDLVPDDQKLLLLSGPRHPRIGGIMLSPLKARKQIEKLIENDPFYQQQIADYEIIEFTPVKYDAVLADFC